MIMMAENLFKPLKKISPCMVDSSKIICGTVMVPGPGFDFAKFLAAVEGRPGTYHSDTLEIVKIDFEGMVFIISKKGTVMIRQAQSLLEAERALRKLLFSVRS